jgi:hypothetical protein
MIPDLTQSGCKTALDELKTIWLHMQMISRHSGVIEARLEDAIGQ